MATKQEITVKIEALKQEKNILIGNCGDTTINQREIYRVQIREIQAKIDVLVTERLNAKDETETVDEETMRKNEALQEWISEAPLRDAESGAAYERQVDAWAKAVGQDSDLDFSTPATNTGRRDMTTKLSKREENVIEKVAKRLGNTPNAWAIAGAKSAQTEAIKPYLDYKFPGGTLVRLSKAGIKYAQSKGWLASEAATVEAESDEPETEIVYANDIKVGDTLYIRTTGVTMPVVKRVQFNRDLSNVTFFFESGAQLSYMSSQTVLRVVKPVPAQEAQQPAPEPMQAKVHGGAYGMDGVENVIVKDVAIGDEVFFAGWCTIASIEHQSHGWTYFVDSVGKSFPLPTLGTINRRIVSPATPTEPIQAGEGFMRPCEHCKGVGSKLDAYDGYSRPCEYCDGTGIHDGTRIPLDMIPDAHFTDVAQLATYANERRHSVTGDLECVECKGNGGFNAWMGWRQCKNCNGAGYLPTINVHTDSTPLAVLHEAIKALNGVNDPALRTRDCVERTERALGLLVDELLPLMEAQHATLDKVHWFLRRTIDSVNHINRFVPWQPIEYPEGFDSMDDSAKIAFAEMRGDDNGRIRVFNGGVRQIREQSTELLKEVRNKLKSDGV